MESATKGTMDGRTLGRIFAWLRPNDLVWAYWLSNYLMGSAPPAFDILYWNNDTTRLPAHLHAEYLDMARANPRLAADQLTVCETPIDLKRVACDNYVIGGMSDHVTPWRGCYRSTSTFGGDSRFVLNSSGHIQTLITTPTAARAKFFTNEETPESPGSSRHAELEAAAGTYMFEE